MIEVPIKPTGKETSASTQRVHNGLVHDQELKVLLWMCERTPEWVTPDLLTLLALLSSFVCAGSYFVSSSRPEFLHLANICIVLHWLGDSMDGQLARFRNKPRPNYGLFVDMMCDMFAIASICIGMGNSVMNIFVALAMLCSFYLLTVVHLFILKFRNDHKVSAGKFSGTEARMILIMANLLWYFRPSYELYLALNVVAITIFLFLSFMVVVSAVDLGMELKEKDEAALAARLQTAKH